MRHLSLIKIMVAHDMAVFVKSGGALVLAVVLALLGAACYVSLPMSVFERGSMPAVSVALVNPDESAYAQTIYSLMKDLPEIDELSWLGADEAGRMLAAGEVSVVVELPEDIVGALVDNRPATVKIMSNNPLAGASAYSVASSAANAMNTVQTAVYEYSAVARPLFGNDVMFYISYNKFCLDLISDAVSYNKLMETPEEGASPYAAQLLSMMLFFVCAGGALGVSVQGAAQKASGGLRRLRGAGAGFGHVFCGRMFSSALAGVFMALLLVLSARAVMPGLSAGTWGMADGLSGAAGGASGLAGMARWLPGAAVGRFLAAAVVLSALVAPVFVMISFFAASAGQAALGGAGFMLVSLFVGGGFYPAYLFGGGFMAFNPARLNMLLVDWSAGGGFPGGQALACFGGALVCSAASWAAWRKAL